MSPENDMRGYARTKRVEMCSGYAHDEAKDNMTKPTANSLTKNTH